MTRTLIPFHSREGQTNANVYHSWSMHHHVSICIYSIVNLVFFTWDSWSFLGLQNDVKSFASHQIIVPIYINLHSCWNIFSCMFVEHWKCANYPFIRKKRRHLPPSATHWVCPIKLSRTGVTYEKLAGLRGYQPSEGMWKSLISPTWAKRSTTKLPFWGSQISLVLSFKKNMKSNWKSSPIFGVKITKIFETTTWVFPKIGAPI